jgi:hypothetical protein
MIRFFLSGLLLAFGPVPAAWAQASACPVPESAALGEIALPWARAGVVQRGALVVLVLGASASVGDAAHGAAFTTSARLQHRLRAALPGVDVRVVTRAAPHRTARMTLQELPADLAEVHPTLVIWHAGAIEAGLGTNLDSLAASLEQGIERIRAAKADVILVDLQYAPSIARIVDLEPYHDALLRIGASNDVPVLDRYALMQAWSESGLLDLDVTTPAAREEVARRVFDCMAAALVPSIVAAVRPQAPP